MTLAIVADPPPISPAMPAVAPPPPAAEFGTLPICIRTEADLERLLISAGPAIKAVLVRKFSTLTPSDAEDVLSVALHRVWTHREAFDARRSSLRSWFFCIAHRAALDVLKLGWQKARQLEHPLEEGSHWAPAAAGESGDEEESTASSQQAELFAALHECLAELPETQRQILWADALGAAAGGVSSEMLGRELGLPAGTVRVYRKRALDRLRAALLKRNPHALPQTDEC